MALNALVPVNNSLVHKTIGLVANFGPFKTVAYGVSVLTAMLVTRPAADLYLNGPTALGFWGGMDPEDICARLTGTNSNMWLDENGPTRACTDVISTRFTSWMIFIRSVTYFGVPLVLLWRYVRRRPSACRACTARRMGTSFVGSPPIPPDPGK